jgi:hypothetical protein
MPEVNFDSIRALPLAPRRPVTPPPSESPRQHPSPPSGERAAVRAEGQSPEARAE